MYIQEYFSNPIFSLLDSVLIDLTDFNLLDFKVMTSYFFYIRLSNQST